MKGLLLSVLVVSTLLLSGCVSNAVESDSNGNLNVVVSILPQKHFVEAVGGGLVNVNELIPPGSSPATYEPNPSDLVLVEEADVYFRVGYVPFEKSHVDELAALNPDMLVVDTSVSVELRYFGGESDERRVDPHLWLSPTRVKKQVDVIAETLSEEDPENAGVYQSNAEAFKEELDELHFEIQAEFAELKSDTLMVFHPAWGYFAEDYGLEQVAIEQSGKEPTAEELQELIDLAREENVKVIFVQTQFNQEIAESIAEEVGAVVVSINPLAEDYVNNLRSVATAISENLNK